MNIMIIADAPNEIVIPTKKFDIVIALDGAADKLLKHEVTPDYVIGDLDTINVATIAALEAKKGFVIQDHNQSSTDLDKGILLADSLGATSITIINSQGGRTDHSLYNIKALRTHYKKNRNIVLLQSDEYIEFLKDCSVSYSASAGDQFAVFGMPRALVTSNGLLYELNAYELEFSVRESSSNVFANDNVTLEVTGEVIVIAPGKATRIN